MQAAREMRRVPDDLRADAGRAALRGARRRRTHHPEACFTISAIGRI
jgi:hypothetical protein